MMPSLPTYIFIDDLSLKRASVNNTVRSDMEVGPQKTRPIQKIPMFQCQMDITICNEDLNAFRAWFINELGSGAYWFLMNDPFDGTRRRFRFMDGQLQWQKNGNNLRTSINLEAYDEL